MSLPSRLVLLLLLFAVVFSSYAQQASAPQSSTPISQAAEPLWSTLLSLTNGLPSQIDSFQATSLAQVNSLIASNSQLQASNSELKTSNDSLSQSNRDLKTSLSASQADLATSEAQRAQLQKDLDASMQSITQAQGAAKALELENGLWKTGAIVASIGAADLALKAFTGKDAIEWIISFVKK
jgi:LPS O-antigen subunit length determinant protein (WzzB/FepE family)